MPTEFSTESLQAALDGALTRHRHNTGGENASYIPILASADPAVFGLAAVTADGRTVTAGDAAHEFPIESISKVFTMALVMNQVTRHR